MITMDADLKVYLDADEPPLPFTEKDLDASHAAWRCNCGPSALAVIANMTLDTVRKHMGDFEKKGYTNPTLMREAMISAGLLFHGISLKAAMDRQWPVWGLVRIQWHGAWMRPGVPMPARYRHTHWVASCRTGKLEWVYDCNAAGWVPQIWWKNIVAPHIIQHAEPAGDGGWSMTHIWDCWPRPEIAVAP